MLDDEKTPRSSSNEGGVETEMEEQGERSLLRLTAYSHLLCARTKWTNRTCSFFISPKIRVGI